MNNKHIHFIGICGVAMSALALALKRAGYSVTGSDKGVYPPISTYLKESGIDYYVGWHVEKMGNPDLVVVGNVAGSQNPEWLHVQENNISYKSYPEVVSEFFIKEKSIVCAGTYGKTSTSALLSWILTQTDMDPSYMFGGLSQNNIPSANIGKPILSLNEVKEKNPDAKQRDPSAPASSSLHSEFASAQDYEWSIVEGDEYKSSRWDNKAKFFHYKPTHLLLTACKWDHADVYPTEQSYMKAFDELIELVPKDGLIVASEHVTHNMDHITNIIRYGKSETNDYKYSNVVQTQDGLDFDITLKSKTYNLKPKILGTYQAENITACFAMAHQIGIEPEKIISSIESFKGIKRRLEKRFVGDATIIDDIAHSPDKAQSALQTLSNIYSEPQSGEESVEAKSDTLQSINVNQNKHTSKDPHGRSSSLRISPRIIAIFEPNGGNRQQESIPGYDNKFVSADEVIIPRLTRIKQDPTKPENLDGEKLAQVISKTHRNAKYITDDEEIINYLVKNTNKNDVVVFLGSHGFRNMIENLIEKYENS